MWSEETSTHDRCLADYATTLDQSKPKNTMLGLALKKLEIDKSTKFQKCRNFAYIQPNTLIRQELAFLSLFKAYIGAENHFRAFKRAQIGGF